MSVPVPMRSKHVLEAQTVTDEFITHTVLIMSNQNVFRPENRVLAERTIDTILSIGEDLWHANGIRVGDDPRKWARRKALQERACEGIDNALYYMRLCYKANHMRGKKYYAWVDKAKRAQSVVRAWRDSDARRFGHLESWGTGC